MARGADAANERVSRMEMDGSRGTHLMQDKRISHEVFGSARPLRRRQPGSGSDVFVSANYKLSFDILRAALKGLDAWVLVLDTKGINVWCAAGKGTFGTDELIRRISEAALERVVSHTRVIVPQLGAPGVSASAVQRATGFRVHYGPVEARDIREYLAAGAMQRKGCEGSGSACLTGWY